MSEIIYENNGLSNRRSGIVTARLAIGRLEFNVLIESYQKGFRKMVFTPSLLDAQRERDSLEKMQQAF